MPVVKNLLLLGIVALTSCSATISVPASTSTFTCSGNSYGTVTSAPSLLSATVDSNNNATGTFTNNGTVFNATGQIYIPQSGISTVNLSLKAVTTGSLTGSIDTKGNFEGYFKGAQGNYRTLMACTGSRS